MLARGGLDPTVVVGGRLRALGTHAQLGHGLWTGVEAARRFRADDADPAGLYATRGVWHVIAWFGVSR